jgi:hypothetical protein
MGPNQFEVLTEFFLSRAWGAFLKECAPDDLQLLRPLIFQYPWRFEAIPSIPNRRICDSQPKQLSQGFATARVVAQGERRGREIAIFE